VRWCDETVHYGGLTAAAGHLIALSDTGELVIGAAGPDGFELKTKQPVVDGKCWTTPVLAEGRLYCRTAEGTLVCLDLRP
jgi:outer membrane protein assembly factor BamB